MGGRRTERAAQPEHLSLLFVHLGGHCWIIAVNIPHLAKRCWYKQGFFLIKVIWCGLRNWFIKRINSRQIWFVSLCTCGCFSINIPIKIKLRLLWSYNNSFQIHFTCADTMSLLQFGAPCCHGAQEAEELGRCLGWHWGPSHGSFAGFGVGHREIRFSPPVFPWGIVL